MTRCFVDEVKWSHVAELLTKLSFEAALFPASREMGCGRQEPDCGSRTVSMVDSSFLIVVYQLTGRCSVTAETTLSWKLPLVTMTPSLA